MELHYQAQTFVSWQTYSTGTHSETQNEGRASLHSDLAPSKRKCLRRDRSCQQVAATLWCTKMSTSFLNDCRKCFLLEYCLFLENLMCFFLYMPVPFCAKQVRKLPELSSFTLPFVYGLSSLKFFFQSFQLVSRCVSRSGGRMCLCIRVGYSESTQADSREGTSTLAGSSRVTRFWLAEKVSAARIWLAAESRW